jgi:hypothetical protein
MSKVLYLGQSAVIPRASCLPWQGQQSLVNCTRQNVPPIGVNACTASFVGTSTLDTDSASLDPFVSGPVSQIMAALIAIYPPLGQVTQLRGSGEIIFHAVLEVPNELPADAWQLALWHSSGSHGDWTETELLPDAPDVHRPALHETHGTKSSFYYTARLVLEAPLTFTVKYRTKPNQDWHWVRDEQGLDDGMVLADHTPAGEHDSDDLPDLIQHLNPDLPWRSHMSQSPGTRLWSIDARVDGAKDGESAYAQVPLGIPWGRFLR